VASRRLPGLFRLCDPEIVWDTSHFHDWPESAYHGVEGVERFLTGKLIRMDNFEDRGEALEAAGLRQSWPHQQPS
jgi:hypothetical protein